MHCDGDEEMEEEGDQEMGVYLQPGTPALL